MSNESNEVLMKYWKTLMEDDMIKQLNFDYDEETGVCKLDIETSNGESQSIEVCSNDI